MRIGAILLMGGSGERFGGDTPKQFRMLGEKPIYAHALEAMKTFGLFDEIVLLSHPDWTFEESSISGGKSRRIRPIPLP